MIPALVAATRLAVAALIGLAVGFERERSGHASGPDARFAGLRTFFLLGLLGGSAGLLLGVAPLPASALLAGGGALVVGAYVVAVRRPSAELDGTTEAAALVVIALGTLAGAGQLALASGTAAVVVLALSEKARLHWIVHRVGSIELRAGLQFAVLALVVLPLLPAGPYGPLGGIRPRALWTVVLLFSALSFLGYVARRAVGPRRGYPVAGLLGGLLSSTAVTLQFARESRDDPPSSRSLAIGVVAASAMLIVRVAVVAAVLDPAVAVALVPYLAPPAIVGIIVVITAFLRTPPADPATAAADGRSPLRLRTAIQMAALLQLVLMATTFVRDMWGSRALLGTAALFGLTDVDALTFAMTEMSTTPAEASIAAAAIAIGVISNSVLKGVAALALGSPRFRPIATGGLLALGGAAAVGFILTR